MLKTVSRAVQFSYMVTGTNRIFDPYVSQFGCPTLVLTEIVISEQSQQF